MSSRNRSPNATCVKPSPTALLHRRRHRALVHLVRTRRRNRNLPERQPQRVGLRLQQLDAHRMHRHALMDFVHRRQHRRPARCPAAGEGRAPSRRNPCRRTTTPYIWSFGHLVIWSFLSTMLMERPDCARVCKSHERTERSTAKERTMLFSVKRFAPHRSVSAQRRRRRHRPAAGKECQHQWPPTIARLARLVHAVTSSPSWRSLSRRPKNPSTGSTSSSAVGIAPCIPEVRLLFGEANRTPRNLLEIASTARVSSRVVSEITR